MAYKIVDIEGIGPVYAEKLAAAGIANSDQLLEKGKTAKGRKELEEATGITGSLPRFLRPQELIQSRNLPPAMLPTLKRRWLKSMRHRTA